MALIIPLVVEAANPSPVPPPKGKPQKATSFPSSTKIESPNLTGTNLISLDFSSGGGGNLIIAMSRSLSIKLKLLLMKHVDTHPYQ